VEKKRNTKRMTRKRKEKEKVRRDKGVEVDGFRNFILRMGARIKWITQDKM
jgi:hypothetical protein